MSLLYFNNKNYFVAYDEASLKIKYKSNIVPKLTAMNFNEKNNYLITLNVDHQIDLYYRIDRIYRDSNTLTKYFSPAEIGSLEIFSPGAYLILVSKQKYVILELNNGSLEFVYTQNLENHNLKDEMEEHSNETNTNNPNIADVRILKFLEHKSKLTFL